MSMAACSAAANETTYLSRAPTTVTNGTAFLGESFVNGASTMSPVNGTCTMSPVNGTGTLSPVPGVGTTCLVPNGTQPVEAELQQCRQQEQQEQQEQQLKRQQDQQQNQQRQQQDQQHEQEQEQKNDQQQNQQQEQDRRSWDEYFMSLAFLCAQRSKDPVTQVGACIANGERAVLSTGYNGMPSGCPDHRMPWGKARRARSPLDAKHLFVCHAEMNAVLNKNSADIRGAQMHVTLHPCNECAKLIIQAGIASVVYYSDKHANKDSTVASKLMLKQAGVECRQYSGELKKLTLTFGRSNQELVSSSTSSGPHPSSLTQNNQSNGDASSDVTLRNDINQNSSSPDDQRCAVFTHNQDFIPCESPAVSNSLNSSTTMVDSKTSTTSATVSTVADSETLTASATVSTVADSETLTTSTTITKISDSLSSILISSPNGESEHPRPSSVYLKWDEYFMGAAFLAARRCEDTLAQAGACLVNSDLRIVGIGYNTLIPSRRSSRSQRVTDQCHAEVNAILHKNSPDVRGCSFYVTHFPCNECAKVIVQSGIPKVTYFSHPAPTDTRAKAAMEIFDQADVKYVMYSSLGQLKKEVTIDFQ